MSRDFGAPGPRGFSGGTARFSHPPLPPGSAREESGGEFSRDHGPPHQYTACAALSFCSPPSRERPARAAETSREGGGPCVTWVGAAAILSLPPQRAVAQRVMAVRRGGGTAAPRTYRPPSPATRSAGPDMPACVSAGLRPSPVLATQRQVAVSRSPQHTAGGFR